MKTIIFTLVVLAAFSAVLSNPVHETCDDDQAWNGIECHQCAMGRNSSNFRRGVNYAVKEQGQRCAYDYEKVHSAPWTSQGYSPRMNAIIGAKKAWWVLTPLFGKRMGAEEEWDRTLRRAGLFRWVD